MFDQTYRAVAVLHLANDFRGGVCGPVVDVEDQVRSQTPSSVAFIHVEIYKNNTVADGFLPQVAAWHLPTEPWTFVIDRTGRISSRFEGALSADELTAAVKKVQ